MGTELFQQYVVLAGYAVLSVWLFWALYVFAMGVYRAELSGRLKGLNRFMAIPIFVVAYLLDIAMNLTIFTLLFLELPDTWLVTSRLQNHMRDGDGWRRKFAEYLCDHILDPFDPKGDHC